MEIKVVPSLGSVNGTSWRGHRIEATRSQLIAIMGEPTYYNPDVREKVQTEFVGEVQRGDKAILQHWHHVVTIYDWNKHRIVPDDEVIVWHIGGRYAEVAELAMDWLNNQLKRLTEEA